MLVHGRHLAHCDTAVAYPIKYPTAHSVGTPTHGMQSVAPSGMKPRLHVQLHPMVNLELLGMAGHEMHE